MTKIEYFEFINHKTLDGRTPLQIPYRAFAEPVLLMPMMGNSRFTSSDNFFSDSERDSAYSQANSTQPILQDMHFDPPNPPFNHSSRRDSSTSTQGSSAGFISPVSPFSSPSRSRNPSPAPQYLNNDANLSNVSLTVNYIPTKFSNPSLGLKKRKGNGKRRELSPGAGLIPKIGGGVDVFKVGEARMGGEDDDEDERLNGGSKNPWTKQSGRKLRWNRFKWILFATNLMLTIYSFVTLILCLLTWFNVWDEADIVRVGNHTELTLSTLASCAGILTCLVGWAGILTNNRAFLAVYTFLLWIVFMFILIPGYMTYKRRTFNLEGKINAQWSKGLGEEGRVRIQNQLKCCGYFSPFVEATVSQTCYARSILPGCKLKYLMFERKVLKRWYTIAFGLVPFHLAVMIAGLLCSNHITYRFGKGMMPKAYRLSMTSMAMIMDNYASQLAEQYGDQMASDVLTRSRSNLRLDVMPTMPYTRASSKAPAYQGTRYDALDPKSPGRVTGNMAERLTGLRLSNDIR